MHQSTNKALFRVAPASRAIEALISVAPRASYAQAMREALEPLGVKEGVIASEVSRGKAKSAITVMNREFGCWEPPRHFVVRVHQREIYLIRDV